MKTAGDKAGVQATREGKGPAAGVAPEVLRVVSGLDPNGERGWVPRVTGGGTRKRRDRERGRGGSQGVGQGRGDQGGEGEDCELASDVALPFLGFTSFIRRTAGSSRAVELRLLLFLLRNTRRIQTRSCR